MNSIQPSHTANDVIFSLQGVHYRYGGHHLALDGIDLEVRRGEQVVLLGANGCGKSTLLKMLDGIYAPTEGSMHVLGREIKAVAAGEDAFQFHREVGFVFQDPDVQLFSATVFDDVAFGPLQLGLTSKEVKERCQEAMSLMDITHLAKRAPFELSGGEKKRAAIASVLSLRPDVILLDEPTASLDPRTKWVLVNLIRKLGEAGKTVITTTHELEIVPIIAQRVVVIGEERRVLADGTPESILGDRDLLIQANLIHPQLHEMGMEHHLKRFHHAADPIPDTVASHKI
jgi:cobalt/nickel transport system ATP-binding protein